MATSANARESRLQRRFDKLTSGDAQLIAAQPDPAITAALDGPGVLLTDVIRTVMTGYADRPALGQRAVEFVTDAVGPHGRRAAAPLRHPDLPRDVGPRKGARRRPGRQPRPPRRPRRDARLHQRRLRRRGHGPVPDRSRRGTAADQCACAHNCTRSCSRPSRWQSSPASTTSMTPSNSRLTAHAPKRLVVFDYHPQIDDHREAFESAAARLADQQVTVEALDDVIKQGAQHTDGPEIPRGDGDDLRLLIYTSGSTGTPKGAMYTDRLMAKCWARMVRPRMGHRRQAAGDHLELHAHQPRDGPRHPVLHTGRGRDGLLRRQERPVHPARRPRPGAPDQARPRPPHLGDAVPGGAERSRPPHHRRQPTGTPSRHR